MKREELAGRTNFLNKTKRIAKQTTRELPTGADGEGERSWRARYQATFVIFPRCAISTPWKLFIASTMFAGDTKLISTQTEER